MNNESSSIEYKETVTDKIKYTLVAFANSIGGTLYIGIRDDGTVVGVENPDEVMLQITNIIRNAIQPDLVSCSDVKTEIRDGKTIVSVSVISGSQKPYFIEGKGIRPEGVYIRQGSSSVPATYNTIRSMLLQTSGDCYEKMKSIVQELTFEESTQVFKKRQISFGKAQQKTLGFIDSDGLYTNLALLFSDQCPHIIKAARFCGTDKEEFQNREIFSGSLLKQVDDAFDYLTKYNQLHAKINGIYREDNYDYPINALREALFNAVIHRDYAYQTSPILISIFDDRIEITNPGGLMPGFDEKDLYNGVSALRNEAVADIFYRLVLIEAYGTGIRKIMNSYTAYDMHPALFIGPNSFRIVLPNTNAKSEETNKAQLAYNVTNKETLVKEDEVAYAYTINESPRTKEFLELFNTHDTLTRFDIQEMLGVSQATAILDIKNLLSRGLIIKVGQGKHTNYRLKK